MTSFIIFHQKHSIFSLAFILKHGILYGIISGVNNLTCLSFHTKKKQTFSLNMGWCWRWAVVVLTSSLETKTLLYKCNCGKLTASFVSHVTHTSNNRGETNKLELCQRVNNLHCLNNDSLLRYSVSRDHWVKLSYKKNNKRVSQRSVGETTNNYKINSCIYVYRRIAMLNNRSER